MPKNYSRREGPAGAVTTVHEFVKYIKGGADPEDNSGIAVEFVTDNDDSIRRTYAAIRAIATDVSANTEDARLEFRVPVAGAMTEIVRINSDGLVIADGYGLVLGDTTQVTISDGDGATNLIPEFQVVGLAAADGSILVAAFNTTNDRTVSPHIALLKGAAATAVATTAVADNEVIGSIIAYGSDGADFETPVGAIEFVVDDPGAPGAGAIGGSIEVFTTADGGETLTRAFSVTSAQNILVGTSTTTLTISDGDGATDLIAAVQVLGLTAADATVAIAAFNTTNDRTVAPHLAFVKGAAATQVATTAVADNEVLGEIIAYASDGTDFETPVASLQFLVDDATPAAGQIGGEIILFTSPVNSETLTARLTVHSDGAIAVANSAPKVTLGTESTFGMTQPTNTLVMREGTAPAGAITTAGGLFSSATVVRKIIADGTVSNVET